MGKVVVNEAYLDLLKACAKVEEQPLLRAKHLPKYLTEKPNDFIVRHTDAGQTYVEKGNVATEWEPSPIEQEMDMLRMEKEVDSEFRHNMITDELLNLYLKKNTDYGNSFDISLDDDGLLVAKIRLGDKYKRFESLLKKKQQEVIDESMRDTLIDMANYAIMTVMWMDRNQAVKEPVQEGFAKGFNDHIDAMRYSVGTMAQVAHGDKDLIEEEVQDTINTMISAGVQSSIDIDEVLNKHQPTLIKLKKAGLI